MNPAETKNELQFSFIIFNIGTPTESVCDSFLPYKFLQ